MNLLFMSDTQGSVVNHFPWVGPISVQNFAISFFSRLINLGGTALWRNFIFTSVGPPINKIRLGIQKVHFTKSVSLALSNINTSVIRKSSVLSFFKIFLRTRR